MTVYRLETGRISRPHLATAIVLADALGCNREELFPEEEVLAS
jgi:hypothetical protein